MDRRRAQQAEVNQQMREAAAETRQKRLIERIINMQTTCCTYEEYREERRAVQIEKAGAKPEGSAPQDRQIQPQDTAPAGASVAPINHDEEEDSCPICFIELDVDEEIRVTVCDHIFHKECILQWIETKLKKK